MTRKKGNSDWALFIVILVVLVCCWAGGWWLIHNFIKADPSSAALLSDQGARGLFGDQFGAITSLFTTFTFMGIVFAILQQRRELSAQSDSIEWQSKVLAVQSFETGFFNLLDQYRSIISQLKISAGSEGREVYAFFLERMTLDGENFPVFNILRKLSRAEVVTMDGEGKISPAVKQQLEKNDIESLEDFIINRKGAIKCFLDTDFETHHIHIEQAYHKASDRINNSLAHCFRTIYIIYKYIDSAVGVEEDRKKDYARIVRAFLSDDELLSIFYNSLIRPSQPSDYEFGFYKMTYYVDKYDVMQNFSKSKLIHPIHWEIFDKLKNEAKSKMESAKEAAK